MKTKNKILILLLSLFLLCGCRCSKDVMEEGIAYGIVYKDYVGRASVKTVNGKITSITIDEAFLPHTWGALKADSPKENATDEPTNPSATTDTIEIDGTKYPTYIKIDQEILKASEYDSKTAENDGTTNQKIMWSNTKIPNLYTYLQTESNAKWYYEALQNKKVYPCDSTGKKLDLEFAKNKYFKSEGGYWDKWEPNIKELTKGMVTDEFKNEPTMTEDSKVKFGETVTSATLAGYQDYYKLAKKAYNKIPKDDK